MRYHLATAVVACFLTTATGCAPSDSCGAAASKLSECTGRPMAAMPSCDSDAAEQILLASCDQINAPDGKATDGWVVAAIAAAVVGGAIWFFSGDDGQANAASSQQTPATGQQNSNGQTGYRVDHNAPYGVATQPVNTHTGSPNALNAGQPTSAPVMSASPSAGPARATNANNCASIGNQRQCVGSMKIGRPSYDFRTVGSSYTCADGHEFRICKTTGGQCGLEYCLPGTRRFSGQCSVEALAAGNRGNFSFSRDTVDGKPLRCTGGTASAQTGPTGNGYGPNIQPCGSGGTCASGTACTVWGCLPHGIVTEGRSCMDVNGKPATPLCKAGLSCVFEAPVGETDYVCKRSTTRAQPCTVGSCGAWKVCSADAGCVDPYKRQIGEACADPSNEGIDALCASANCDFSAPRGWHCVAPTPTPQAAALPTAATGGQPAQLAYGATCVVPAAGQPNPCIDGLGCRTSGSGTTTCRLPARGLSCATSPHRCPVGDLLHGGRSGGSSGNLGVQRPGDGWRKRVLRLAASPRTAGCLRSRPDLQTEEQRRLFTAELAGHQHYPVAL